MAPKIAFGGEGRGDDGGWDLLKKIIRDPAFVTVVKLYLI